METHLNKLIKNLPTHPDLTIIQSGPDHYTITNKDTELTRATILTINAITYIPQDQGHQPGWHEWHIADPNLLPQLNQLIKELPPNPQLNPLIHIA